MTMTISRNKSFDKRYNHYQRLPAVIAHRGASGVAPENTLVAFETAHRQGASWIETDVQITADGGLVIYHDFEFGRTSSGKGRIADLPLREVAGRDAGSWFSHKFKGEGVPSIREVFDVCAEWGMGINLEVKCHDQKHILPTTKALVKFLRHYPGSLPLEVSSFDFEVLYYLSKELPELRLGFLIGGISPEMAMTGYWRAIMKKIHGYALHVGYSLVSPELVQEVKSSGYEFFVYTVDNPRVVRKLWAIGVDSICTNFPDRMVAASRLIHNKIKK